LSTRLEREFTALNTRKNQELKSPEIKNEKQSKTPTAHPVENLSRLKDERAIGSAINDEVARKQTTQKIQTYDDVEISQPEKTVLDNATTDETPDVSLQQSSKRRSVVFPNKLNQNQDIDDFDYHENRRKRKTSKSSQRRTRKTYIPHPLRANGFSNSNKRHYEKGPQKIRIASMSSNSPKRKKM
jgi:hypothetical protein